MKNNLEHSALPTPEEIRLYHEGKLGPMRSHEIELLAQENPLLAEALEGFAAKPSYSMLPVIQAGIIEASSAGAAGTLGTAGAAILKAGTPWWHLNGWWIGVVTGTAAAVGTAVVMESNKEKAEITNPDIENIRQSESIETPSITSSEDTIAFESATAETGSNQLTTVQTRTNGAENQTGSAIDDASRNQTDLSSIRPVEAGDIVFTEKPETSNPALEPKRSSTIAIGIIHVLNYKLADYTALRQNNWQKFSLQDVGVPARFSSEEDRNKYLKENPDQSIPYIDYISQCIRAYDENKFAMTIDKFAEVLKQYPDDVNALFYTAMSHYKTGNYTTAVDLFAKVEKNFINTFNEEALFYHGKSLKKLDRFEEAISYFVKVVKWNGFYKEQAITEMETED